MQVRLIAVTEPRVEIDGKRLTAEELLVYTARVSSPQNQENTATGARLLKYCLEHGHWSVFEQADMTVEIETSRAIAAQILRHRSFTFQEFSQRYADASELGFEDVRPRRQDTKNRQNSTDDLDEWTAGWFHGALALAEQEAQARYEHALKLGIAKESARFLLPLSTRTRLYMKGSVRSWLHYLEARTHESAQREHREVAEAIREIFRKEFPTVAEAVWGV